MSVSVVETAARWSTLRLEYLRARIRARIQETGAIELRELNEFQDRIGATVRWGNLLSEHREAFENLIRTENTLTIEDWEAVYAGRDWDGKMDGTLYLYMLLTRLYKERWLGQARGEKKAQ